MIPESVQPDRSFKLFEELEKIELAEDIFGTSLIHLAFHNRRDIANYLVLQLRGWGPNSVAADFLRQLATKRNSPALAQGLHESWREEQIGAVIEEIFNIGDPTAGGDNGSMIPVGKPRGPKPSRRAAAQSVDDEDASDRR